MRKLYTAMIGGEIGINGSPIKPCTIADRLNAQNHEIEVLRKLLDCCYRCDGHLWNESFANKVKETIYNETTGDLKRVK